ncbi:GDSL-type esterase/lipase family protein [Flavobacteriaceae bacterium]|nr:GDSL-type esterase/lipase family protein [Flavobacteriaceae bacterium]MDC1285114.1 GDSL-type esterase/lipase family protein [Flavobacteriaceae bacterium]
MKKLILLLIITCITSSIFAQDWANLERFKEENTSIMQEEITEKRIVFMGNSITEGWSNFDSVFFSENQFINRGIGGQTTPQMLLRFKQDVIDIKANTVIILAGINDIAENTGPISLKQILGNIISMCELANQNNIRVILCSVIPANEFPWEPKINPTQKVIDLNEMLLDYANSKSITYVDYYSKMVDDKQGLIPAYGYDPVHPNQDGYVVMKHILSEVLEIK